MDSCEPASESERDHKAEHARSTVGRIAEAADNTNKGNGVDAATYDQRVEAGRKKGASWADVGSKARWAIRRAPG